MKLGIVLPTFRATADEALVVADQAERAGLDGVFAYDHLFPMGAPERPALTGVVILGAVVARTDRVVVGPLVARVGVVPDAVLAGRLVTLGRLAGPGRFVAGVGAGDRKSLPESDAYRAAFRPLSERTASVAVVARATLEAGQPVWLGGGSGPITAVAQEVGAAVNLWGVDPEEVARRRSAAPDLELTWGGEPPAGGLDALVDLLARLARAGATWCVMGARDGHEALVGALAEAGRRLGADPLAQRKRPEPAGGGR